MTGRRRIEIESEGSRSDSGRIDLSDLGRAAPAQGDSSTIQLRSGALLIEGERQPIPEVGLSLDRRGFPVTDTNTEGGGSAIRIVPTDSGHALDVVDESEDVLLNGERLIAGERRPLADADSVAIGGNIVYYIPPGSARTRLPRVSPIDKGRLTGGRREERIGRSPECDFVLDYPTVSNFHATVRTSNGQTTIQDNGSATRTMVNGVPVRRARLVSGDEIAIGPFRLVFDGAEVLRRSAADGLAIEGQDLEVEFGSKAILRPTDVSIRAGEFVALIGESGAGKTTLLKTLAGVEPPRGARIGGTALCGGEPVRQRLTEIGYVPQFDIVHEDLTVFEALDFAARLRLAPDIAREERRGRIYEVLTQLELKEKANLRVSSLSGGQRKRVAVGIELLHRPGAIFLDEPTTGLDPGLEKTMMELFSRMSQSGQTVCLVTHATGSLSLCDRVILMGRGGIKRFDGKPDELLAEFGVSSFDEIYSRLALGHLPRNSDGREPRRLLIDLRSEKRANKVKAGFLHQTRVLSSRYSLLTRRNSKNLIGLAVQTALLGVMTAILFSGVVFERPPDLEEPLVGKAAQLIFLMVTISIWLGSISAAREIVKERDVVRRELAVGVGVNAYLVSKLLILLVLVALQTIAYFLIVISIEPIDRGIPALLLVLLLSSWIAVLTGLVVSAYSSSEDQATGLIPIILVPQLLFGGALVTRNEMPDFVQSLSDLVPSRWAYEAGGTVTDLRSLIFFRPEDSPEAALQPLQSAYRDFFHLESLEFALIFLAFFAGLYLLLFMRVRRLSSY